MNELLQYVDVEALMRQAIMAGLLACAVVFVGGVIFGWEYAMFLAFIVLLALVLVQWLKGR